MLTHMRSTQHFTERKRRVGVSEMAGRRVEVVEASGERDRVFTLRLELTDKRTEETQQAKDEPKLEAATDSKSSNATPAHTKDEKGASSAAAPTQTPAGNDGRTKKAEAGLSRSQSWRRRAPRASWRNPPGSSANPIVIDDESSEDDTPNAPSAAK